MPQLPGSVGGAEWGGAGFDPETGMLCVPPVTDAFAADLTPGNPDRTCGRMAVDAKTDLGL